MEKPLLLLVDDDETIRTQMQWALEDDFQVSAAEDGEIALKQFHAEQPSLVILDLGLPPVPRGAEEGFRVLDEIISRSQETKVIVITGNLEKKNALKAVEMGAFDFFVKPADMEEVKIVLKRALHLSSLEKENAELKSRFEQDGFDGMIGMSPRMRDIYALIRKVATTEASVLVDGESGTGKELVAKAIHRSSNRSSMPFIAINCGAIPENLLESELFGYEKGSFTGADARRKGKIEYADGGTLFLDEIGEMPPLLQVKLLRFLQEHHVERVGGREHIPVNVRVIAATNKDLRGEIREGRFREDLYYRLSVINITVPPLRERGDDVVLLANAFLYKFSSEYQKKVRGFSDDALDVITTYRWPGNVRELENKVRRGVILSTGSLLNEKDIELDRLSKESRVESLRDFREKVEREYINKVLVKWQWNVSRAAGDLGVSRPTLHGLIKKYKMTSGR